MKRFSFLTIISLLSTLAAILLVGVFLTQKRTFHASVPQPPSALQIDTTDLHAQDQACMKNIVIEPRSEVANIQIGTYQQPGVPLKLDIHGYGYSQHVIHPANYTDNEKIRFRLDPPKEEKLVTACIKNLGIRKVALYTSTLQAYKSPVTTYINNKRQRGNFNLEFTEARSRNFLQRTFSTFHRVETLRPSVVNTISLSLLTILIFIFIPISVVWLIHKVGVRELSKKSGKNISPEELPAGVTSIQGPSMVGSDLQRFARLTWTMAVTQFKLRFYGSALGYLWQLMRPLALFGVLYVVFTQFVRVGHRIPFYEVSLLLGIVLFVFFSEATTGSVRSLVDREALIRKVDFPRLAVPCSVVLTAFINLVINLVVVGIFAAFSGVKIRITIFEIFPVIFMFLIFVTGLSIGLSALYLRYRDVNPIWEVIQQITLYGTPIFYTIETVRETNQHISQLLMFNPFATVIQQLRHACIDLHAPSAAAAAGGWSRLCLTIVLTIIIFALGLWMFHHESPRIAEEL